MEFNEALLNEIALLRQTRAASLLRGIVILLLAYFLSIQLELKTMKFLLDNVLQFGLLAIVVVFQPELRRALEQVGRSKFSSLPFFSGKMSSEDKTRWNDAAVKIADSCEQMSKERTGALIVIEKRTALGDIIRTGTVVEADVSCELLETIFYEGSPLHDGAVIIRDGRIQAAGCFLPVSESNELSKDLGTRHRAALGMSENSDAIIIIVSEETGIISVAQDGALIRRLDRSNLFRKLQSELIKDEDEQTENKSAFLSFFERLFKK